MVEKKNSKKIFFVSFTHLQKGAAFFFIRVVSACFYTNSGLNIIEFAPIGFGDGEKEREREKKKIWGEYNF